MALDFEKLSDIVLRDAFGMDEHHAALSPLKDTPLEELTAYHDPALYPPGEMPDEGVLVGAGTARAAPVTGKGGGTPSVHAPRWTIKELLAAEAEGRQVT